MKKLFLSTASLICLINVFAQLIPSDVFIKPQMALVINLNGNDCINCYAKINRFIDSIPEKFKTPIVVNVYNGRESLTEKVVAAKLFSVHDRPFDLVFEQYPTIANKSSNANLYFGDKPIKEELDLTDYSVFKSIDSIFDKQYYYFDITDYVGQFTQGKLVDNKNYLYSDLDGVISCIDMNTKKVVAKYYTDSLITLYLAGKYSSPFATQEATERTIKEYNDGGYFRNIMLRYSDLLSDGKNLYVTAYQYYFPNDTPLNRLTGYSVLFKFSLDLNFVDATYFPNKLNNSEVYYHGTGSFGKSGSYYAELSSPGKDTTFYQYNLAVDPPEAGKILLTYRPDYLPYKNKDSIQMGYMIGMLETEKDQYISYYNVTNRLCKQDGSCFEIPYTNFKRDVINGKFWIVACSYNNESDLLRLVYNDEKALYSVKFKLNEQKLISRQQLSNHLVLQPQFFDGKEFIGSDADVKARNIFQYRFLFN